MSGGGGGGIIIKNAIKSVLTDPLVSGNLPPGIASQVFTVCAKSTDDWTDDDYRLALFAFNFAATHA